MGRLLYQPQTGDAIKQGIDTLARAITPTLGPVTGLVALDEATRKGAPELLDDAGTIARRVLALQNRDWDIGAMLLRETLWEQRKRLGDGAATAAVLYQTVFAAGHRFLRAGGDAMLLRKHLERGMRQLLAELRQQAQAMQGKDEIECLALSICGEPAIAAALADIFEVLGAHSPVEVRAGGRASRHEFFLGAYWEGKAPSNAILEGRAGSRLDLRNSAWLISDFELDDLPALVQLVTDVYQAGYDSLAIVGKSFSRQLIAAQGANSRMPDFTLVYLELSGLLDEQEAALEDLALLTGGQVLRAITGHSFAAVSRDLLGSSELAWLDRNRFGIIAGGGQAAAVHAEASELERMYRASGAADDRRRELLRARIGRLRGGSAVIYAAGSSESEMRFQQERIKRTITALRGGLLEGTLPGGGLALLRCLRPLQQRHDASGDLHERAACQILLEAVQAPCRQLLANAGHEAAGIVIDALLQGDASGFEALAADGGGTQAGQLLDSAAAVMAATRNGIGGAALALTVDTIVHRLNPPLAIAPGGLPADADLGNIELR